MLSQGEPATELIRQNPPPPCWIGQARWQPPLAGPGFYCVNARLAGVATAAASDQFNLAVVTPRHAPAGGEFGWTLPRLRQPLAQAQLVELLSQVASAG